MSVGSNKVEKWRPFNTLDIHNFIKVFVLNPTLNKKTYRYKATELAV